MLNKIEKMELMRALEDLKKIELLDVGLDHLNDEGYPKITRKNWALLYRAIDRLIEILNGRCEYKRMKEYIANPDDDISEIMEIYMKLHDAIKDDKDEKPELPFYV